MRGPLDPWGDGIVVASFDLAPGQRFDWHEHPAHQLSLASGGVLSMGVGDHVWVLPRSWGCGSRPACATASTPSTA